jgi:hypothetical protein
VWAIRLVTAGRSARRSLRCAVAVSELLLPSSGAPGAPCSTPAHSVAAGRHVKLTFSLPAPSARAGWRDHHGRHLAASARHLPEVAVERQGARPPASRPWCWVPLERAAPLARPRMGGSGKWAGMQCFRARCRFWESASESASHARMHARAPSGRCCCAARTRCAALCAALCTPSCAPLTSRYRCASLLLAVRRGYDLG